MGLPVAWTEPTLIAAIEAELEPVMADLGLDALDVTTTAVGTDVPAVLGVTSVETVTYAAVADVVKVLVIARWMAWQKAVDVSSVRFDLKAGTSDLKQSQMWTQLSARLASATAAAMRYSEARVFVGSSGERAAVPVTGTLTTAAPVTPCWPPDANDGRYAGSPYRSTR